MKSNTSITTVNEIVSKLEVLSAQVTFLGIVGPETAGAYEVSTARYFGGMMALINEALDAARSLYPKAPSTAEIRERLVDAMNRPARG
jgi:hypothetical protein